MSQQPHGPLVSAASAVTGSSVFEPTLGHTGGAGRSRSLTLLVRPAWGP